MASEGETVRRQTSPVHEAVDRRRLLVGLLVWIGLGSVGLVMTDTFDAERFLIVAILGLAVLTELFGVRLRRSPWVTGALFLGLVLIGILLLRRIFGV